MCGPLNRTVATRPGSAPPSAAQSGRTRRSDPVPVTVTGTQPFLARAIRKTERVPSTLADLYAFSDMMMPKGNRYAVDGIWTDAPAPDILHAGRHILDSLPTRQSFLLWMLWGHVQPRPTACWSTQSRLYFSPNAVWTDPADDLRNEQWAHAALDEMAAVADGTQFSDANPGDRPDRGLDPAQADRLEQLRGKYDPGGVFRTYLAPHESSTALGRSRRPGTGRL